MTLFFFFWRGHLQRLLSTHHRRFVSFICPRAVSSRTRLSAVAPLSVVLFTFFHVLFCSISMFAELPFAVCLLHFCAVGFFSDRLFPSACCSWLSLSFRYDQRAEALGKKGMIQTDNM